MSQSLRKMVMGSVAAGVLLGLAAPVLAQTAPVAEWEQPEVVGVNREPMKATFFNFESRDLALKGDTSASKRFLSLDGTWDFKFS
ncbi:hypothetical protein PQU94_17570, partial [Asticcacaulis sp. DXS10W]